VLIEFNANVEEENFIACKSKLSFVGYLNSKMLIEDVNYRELRVGSYGELDLSECNTG